MRHFVNAVEGLSDRSREQWEQARLISWYSAFDRKPLKLTDISIPYDSQKKTVAQTHQNKQDAYKLLDKWSK